MVSKTGTPDPVFIEVGIMIQFDTTEYPKFRNAWEADTMFPYDTQVTFMKKLGYLSAEYFFHGPTSWRMSEADYTLFVLRWA